MFKWLRRLRTLPPIPDDAWRATLTRYAFLGELPPAEQQRLRTLAAEFLRDKEFHGTQGFVITDEVARPTAAQAVLPVLHRYHGLVSYDVFVGIVVHPSEVVAPRKVVDDALVVHEYEELVAGEAMDQGPVMLSWQDVLASSVTSEGGYNVVIHEFAHKIDMRNGIADGCPPLPAGFMGRRSAREARAAWLAVLQPAYDDFREKTILAERFGAEPPWLDDYGATSISEFFAVACEAYFVNRPNFARDFPQVVTLFDAFFLPSKS